MTNMLSRIKQNIEQGSSQPGTPIVDGAIALVNDKSIEFAQRLPRIYELVDKAVAAGGAEKEHAGLIIENLYAAANDEELALIALFDEERS